MASNNYIFKMSNAGGMATVTRYTDMLAGNTTWNPWEPQGAYDALSTVTVPSGGVASITFAGIPTGYKHLQIRGSVLGGYVYVQANYNDDTGSNYGIHSLYGQGTSAAADANTPSTKNYISIGYNGTYPQVFITDILDYQNTNKNKTIRSLSGTETNGAGAQFVNLWSGAWRSTSAITSINLTLSGGSFNQYSTVSLYGVR